MSAPILCSGEIYILQARKTDNSTSELHLACKCSHSASSTRVLSFTCNALALVAREGSMWNKQNCGQIIVVDFDLVSRQKKRQHALQHEIQFLFLRNKDIQKLSI